MDHVRAITNRASERITAIAAVLCAGSAVFLAVSVYALLLAYGGTMQSLQSLGQNSDVQQSIKTVGSVANANVCGSWANFVLTQNKAGLTAAQIESVWKVTTAKNGDAKDPETSIASQCGTVPAILKAAGR